MDYTYSFQIKYLDSPERRALQFYRSWQDEFGDFREEIYTTQGWKEAEPWQQTPVEELPQDEAKNRSRRALREAIRSMSEHTGSTTDNTSTF